MLACWSVFLFKSPLLLPHKLHPKNALLISQYCDLGISSFLSSCPLACLPFPFSFWSAWSPLQLHDMLTWAHLSVCHPVHPWPQCTHPPRAPPRPRSTLPRCATTETPRISPLPLLSEWVAPPLAPAPAKTHCRPITVRNRCPQFRRRENLATRSSQSSLGLKKVRRDNSNQTYSVWNLWSSIVLIVM